MSEQKPDISQNSDIKQQDHNRQSSNIRNKVRSVEELKNYINQQFQEFYQQKHQLQKKLIKNHPEQQAKKSSYAFTDERQDKSFKSLDIKNNNQNQQYKQKSTSTSILSINSRQSNMNEEIQRNYVSISNSSTSSSEYRSQQAETNIYSKSFNFSNELSNNTFGANDVQRSQSVNNLKGKRNYKQSNKQKQL